MYYILGTTLKLTVGHAPEDRPMVELRCVVRRVDRIVQGDVLHDGGLVVGTLVTGRLVLSDSYPLRCRVRF